MTAQIFTLGTRGSPLALAQAEETRHRLTQALGWEPGRVALKIIRTTGDLIQDRPLADVGGKGLFTKEIDAALLAGEIDAAVHSAKDLPSLMPEGDRDRGLPATRGPARRADLRLGRYGRGPASGGEFRSRFAASAGSAPSPASRPEAGASSGQCRNAVAQGQIGRDRRDAARHGGPQAARSRSPGPGAARPRGFPSRPRPGRDRADRPDWGRRRRATRSRAIAHSETGWALTAERAFLAELEGSCRTPIAGHARIENGRVLFRGEVLRTDGSESFPIAADGPSADAEALGREAGRELAARLPAGVLVHRVIARASPLGNKRQ